MNIKPQLVAKNEQEGRFTNETTIRIYSKKNEKKLNFMVYIKANILHRKEEVP